MIPRADWEEHQGPPSEYFRRAKTRTHSANSSTKNNLSVWASAVPRSVRGVSRGRSRLPACRRAWLLPLRALRVVRGLIGPRVIQGNAQQFAQSQQYAVRGLNVFTHQHEDGMQGIEEEMAWASRPWTFLTRWRASTVWKTPAMIQKSRKLASHSNQRLRFIEYTGQSVFSAKLTCRPR